jgi:hypothetical protein
MALRVVVSGGLTLRIAVDSCENRVPFISFRGRELRSVHITGGLGIELVYPIGKKGPDLRFITNADSDGRAGHDA